MKPKTLIYIPLVRAEWLPEHLVQNIRERGLFETNDIVLKLDVDNDNDRPFFEWFWENYWEASGNYLTICIERNLTKKVYHV